MCVSSDVSRQGGVSIFWVWIYIWGDHKRGMKRLGVGMMNKVMILCRPNMYDIGGITTRREGVDLIYACLRVFMALKREVVS